MTGSDDDDTRSMDDSGTQREAEAPAGGGGGRSSYGPSTSVGGEQEPGGPVPPYEGRKEKADNLEGDAHRDDANTGGATKPVASEGMKAPKPADTPGGATTSPGGEPPSTEDDADYPADPGVGPGHTPGTSPGESQPKA